jgi:DNA-binding MarR family transcriptional regulator
LPRAAFVTIKLSVLDNSNIWYYKFCNSIIWFYHRRSIIVRHSPSQLSEAKRPLQSTAWHIPAYLARRLQLICATVVNEVVKSENLNPPQWAVLAHISRAPDIDQSSLAEIASVDKTSIGRLVDQLEAMSLVERRANGKDRRVWMLRATPRGQEVRRRVGPKTIVEQERLLSCLTAKERASFLSLFRRVVAANDGLIQPGAGRRKPNRPPKSIRPRLVERI